MSNSICWLCQAGQSDSRLPFTDVSKSALWRKHRFAAGEFVKYLKDSGTDVSPILFCPGFVLAYVCIDVLHCVDLGIALDAIGNLFWILVHEKIGFLTGSTIEARVVSLWNRVNTLYKQHKTPCRLQQLTREMIKRKKTANSHPKLKAKGGECRQLVPIVLQIAEDYAAAYPSAYANTMASLFRRLLDFQLGMGIDDFKPEVLATACRECLLLWKALGWHMKPKIHLWQELCEHQVFLLGDLSRYWNYADESFVGYVSVIASSRGGGRAAATMALDVLHKMKALMS